MKTMNAVDWVAVVLVIIGAINWGLVGIANFDLVATLFGVGSTLTGLVYDLVGLAGLYMIYTATKIS